MKTKIAIILLISGIVVSFGAAKISKAPKSTNQTELQSKNLTSEPAGGFVSEDH